MRSLPNSLPRACHLLALAVAVVVAGLNPLRALSFSEWQAVNFTSAQLANSAVSAAAADPDGDGLSNLAEFVYAGNPFYVESSLAPRVGIANGRLTLTYRERSDLTETEVWLQGGDDLVHWATFNTLEEIARVTGSGYADITLRDPFPISTKRFLRLRLLLTPLPPLQAPANFGLSVENTNQIRLRWSDLNVTETGYAIEKFSLVSQSWERVATLGVDTTDWTDTNLAGYAGIRYRVVTLSADQDIPSDETTVPSTSGVPNWWLLKYFGFLGANLFTDLNANGVDSYNDYLEGNDPVFDFYQGHPPILTEISGGGQKGIAGEYLAAPWVIKVTDSSGTPLANAPVRFTVDQGQLSPDPNTTVSGYPHRVVLTDADGLARIYWKL